MSPNEPGQVWYLPEQFLVTFHPGDGCGFHGHECSGTWHVLEKRREDDRYGMVKASLEQMGWVRAIPWCWSKRTVDGVSTEVRELVDGHTRAAAAIELGMELPLVEVITSVAQADDSGLWQLGDPIEPDVWRAMHPVRRDTYPDVWAEGR